MSSRWCPLLFGFKSLNLGLNLSLNLSWNLSSRSDFAVDVLRRSQSLVYFKIMKLDHIIKAQLAV